MIDMIKNMQRSRVSGELCETVNCRAVLAHVLKLKAMTRHTTLHGEDGQGDMMWVK